MGLENSASRENPLRGRLPEWVPRPGAFVDTRPSLVAALQDGAGDSDWREFFTRYAPPVYRVACMRGINTVDAEDIVQQVMIAILGSIGAFNYERDRSRFRQWVLRIAENKICDVLRKRKPFLQDGQMLNLQADDEPNADEIWQSEWRRQDLLYCLDQLSADISPRRMAAFRLYVLHGVSAAETANQLEMSIGYVYVTRNQILKMLQERLSRLAVDGNAADRTHGASP